MFRTSEEIYDIYLTAKQEITQKKPRKTKLTPKNQEIINNITNYFNTKWQNINPYQYFYIGFTLFKSFNYNMFFHNDIIKTYIQKQKQLHRQSFNKEIFTKSLNYTKQFNDYLLMKDNYTYIFINDYIQNKIDKYTIIYLLSMLSVSEQQQIEQETKHFISEVFNNKEQLLKEIITWHNQKQ
jgi:hypothetical protein